MGDELRERCRHIVRQVLAQRGWKLVPDEAAFAEEVLAEVQSRLRYSRSRPLEKIIEDATVNRYCHLWYEACKADRTLRQRQAFKELHHYLYPFALYRAKYDQRVAEESTQEALIKVWQHLDQVRDPGSFARWASQILVREVLAIKEYPEISEADLKHPGDPKTDETPLTRAAHQAGQTTGFSEPEFTSDMRTRLIEIIEQCLRSTRQQTVIIGFFLEQRGFREMADELRTNVSNIYVLKSRALERLRQCEAFLEMLEEWL